MLLVRLGFSSSQIVKITGISRTYLFTRKRDLRALGLIKSGGAVTSLEEMANKRRSDINKMIAFEKDMDVAIIQDHIEYAKAKKELGDLEENDMILINGAIPMEHDLMTLGNINFVIKYFTEVDELKTAVAFINRCLKSAYDYQDKKIDKLVEIRKFLERKLEKQTATNKREDWINSDIKVNLEDMEKRPKKIESGEKRRSEGKEL